ncbi:MAG: epoxide hydrolase family protein [Dehalococcoidia bacterium]
MTATTIRPFRVSASNEQLADLHERLRRMRFPGEVEGSGWEYGSNLAYLRELVRYWRDQYDWPAAEAALNRLPQFTASVNGLRLHFVYQRGKGPAPLPLLFSHGWPGSFWEVHKILGPLTDPAAHGGDPADAFDVVAPSLPGYGFSEDPRATGTSPAVIADLFATLMTETLDYPRFGAQGGDWGAWIAARLGYAHADKVIGVHLNLFPSRLYSEDAMAPLTKEEQQFMVEAQAWRNAEGGYHAIQATKPQTLAFGLTDSPAGLAAWIVEKFRSWSDCGGQVEWRFTKDDLLTNIMIYWLSGCVGSSMRLYYEHRAHPWSLGPGARIEVPTGFARFAFEITRPPREWVERACDLRHWSDFPRGGHFAALEEPELLVNDLRDFFRPLRGK